MAPGSGLGRNRLHDLSVSELPSSQQHDTEALHHSPPPPPPPLTSNHHPPQLLLLTPSLPRLSVYIPLLHGSIIAAASISPRSRPASQSYVTLALAPPLRFLPGCTFDNTRAAAPDPVSPRPARHSALSSCPQRSREHTLTLHHAVAQPSVAGGGPNHAFQVLSPHTSEHIHTARHCLGDDANNAETLR